MFIKSLIPLIELYLLPIYDYNSNYHKYMQAIICLIDLLHKIENDLLHNNLHRVSIEEFTNS